jgi:hypothetical protein
MSSSVGVVVEAVTGHLIAPIWARSSDSDMQLGAHEVCYSVPLAMSLETFSLDSDCDFAII